MSFKKWCKEVWAGGFWSVSKLNSRKFFLAFLFAACTYFSTFMFVKYSGIVDSGIINTAVDAIRDVVIAYFTVNFVEAGINIYARYQNGKGKRINNEPNNPVEELPSIEVANSSEESIISDSVINNTDGS